MSTSSPTLPQKISIVIPAYNEEKSITNCLDALYSQDSKDLEFEAIVINDCSTDKTAEVVENYKLKNNLSNLHIINNTKNIGRFKTRLKGITKSSHNLVLLVDSKVTLSKTAFSSIKKINYNPLIATNSKNPQKSIIERTYFLIRKKIYKGNYPKMLKEKILLTPENFDTYPKGTTVFLCSRDLLLNSIPTRTDHN